MRTSSHSVVLEKGDAAFQEADFPRAAHWFGKAHADLKVGLDTTDLLSEHSLKPVLDYTRCTLFLSAAHWQTGQAQEVDRLILEAMTRIVPFIDNLGNPLRYRARLVTEYKNLFFGLAAFYTAEHREDQLRTYVQKHRAMLTRWALGLRLIGKEALPEN